MPRITCRQARQRRALTLLISVCTAPAWVASVQAADAFAVDSPWMTGDWGGLRTDWLNKGVDIKMGYTGESASNVHGGYNGHDKVTRYADQFNLGADIDLQKLLGWNDAAFSVSVTNRNGDNINDKIDDPRATSLALPRKFRAAAV